MKKFEFLKTFQLVLYVALAALGLWAILTNEELFQLVGRDPDIRILCVILWAVLGLSFLFIFIEFGMFATFKKEFNELDFVVHSDTVSGLANRYSCDSVIEKYLDRPLPAHIACVMIDLTNIQQINQIYGHLQGNTLIRDFSVILQNAGEGICFVGRNGGNKFLALFENYTEEKLNRFLDLIETNVEHHNTVDGAYPIAYEYGIAVAAQENVHKITDLISLSNRRIYKAPPADKA